MAKTGNSFLGYNHGLEKFFKEVLTSKNSDLKASHDQQLCEKWVSKSVNYLDVGYSGIFDKTFKDFWS